MKGRMARGIWRDTSQTRAIARRKNQFYKHSPDQLDLRESCWVHTQILNILVSGESESTALLTTSRTGAGTECFVDHDTVRCCSCNKSGAVREAGRARIRVEGDVRQAIAKGTKQEC